MRRDRLGAVRRRRIEGQLSEKAAPGRIGAGNLLQLVEIGDAGCGVVKHRVRDGTRVPDMRR